MNRRIRIIGAAAAAAVTLITGAGSAYADTTFDTGMVTVMAETRAIKVDVGGITVVNLDKVSNPGVQVKVTVSDGSMPVASAVHAPGENGCSAVDNPLKGTLNRTITVQGGPWATIYVKAQYTTTTVLGLSTTHVVEPFGPVGLTVTGLGLVPGVPVDVCMA
jgi:hypothetical protein